MASRRRTADEPRPTRRYHSPDVPMSAIRRYCRCIARKFQPDQIILFGSYAYGWPNDGSDVDLLVVIPARDETSQAIRICLELDAPFPLDLIVRSPERLRRRLVEGDWFF